jgi:release factor glutamine methyltransferase
MVSQTVGGALAFANDLGLGRLDAQLLLSHSLGVSRSWVLAHDEAELEGALRAQYSSLVLRRSAGEPLAYLLGEKEFHGLVLKVDARVLIPRPETEHLVDWGLELMARRRIDEATSRVIDLGTGSGAIALAVKSACPSARLTAVDASPAALQVACANAQRLGLAVNFQLSDWWGGLATQTFDLALCNPPYIAAADPHLPALRHEPLEALTAPERGLQALRAVVQGAPARLRPGAWLLLEHGHEQGGDVRRLLRQSAFDEIETRRDLAGLERCTGASWPGVGDAARVVARR